MPLPISQYVSGPPQAVCIELHTTAHERFAKHLSDGSEQQKCDKMAAAAVWNVVNQEIVERKSRHLLPAKGASGLHVCKQISLCPPTPTPFNFSSPPFQTSASALRVTSLYHLYCYCCLHSLHILF